MACSAGLSEEEYCAQNPRDMVCLEAECENGESDMSDPCLPKRCMMGMWVEYPEVCIEMVCLDGSNPPVPEGECCGDFSMCPKMDTCPEVNMGGSCEAYVDGLVCEYGEDCCCDECHPLEVATCMEGEWMTYMADACMNAVCETDAPETTGTVYLVPDLGLLDSMKRMLERSYNENRWKSAGQRAAALLQEKDENNNKVAPLYDPEVKDRLQRVKRFWKNNEDEPAEEWFDKQRNQYNIIAEILNLEQIEM
jgi:hypothetical protein